MQVSRTVLNNVAMYMQWREAQQRANMLEDQLIATVRHMPIQEQQTYEHIVGMYEIGHGNEQVLTMPPPVAPTQLDLTQD